MTKGMIVRALGGFYYVDTPDGEIECRAKGIFRKRGISPVVGDKVAIEWDSRTGKGMVVEIEERKNFLIRPPLANLDQLFFIAAMRDPSPNYLVLDKLIAIAEYKGIEPIIVANKHDLAPDDSFCSVYRRAGFPVYSVSATEGEGIDEIRTLFAGKLSAFAGNTGVGKSTLLNILAPALSLQTGEISHKLGRGRHTTRSVSLYHLEGGWVADTPGFSTVDVVQYEPILKDQLQYCFREFAPFRDRCKFTGCSHTCEKGCMVVDAVERGEIPRSRHQSYCAMYQEALSYKEWEMKKRP